MKKQTKSYIDFSTVEFMEDVKILVAEDNRINQEIIKDLLANDTLQIDTASNGQEALAMFLANKDKYSLILMDLKMPVMDGFEASRQIRTENQSIPIIALSANKNAQWQDEFIEKPIDVDKLYETVLKYLPVKKESIKQKVIESLGSEELFYKIANNFCNTYKHLDLRMLDKRELELITHSIYNLAKTLGFDDLADLSKKIEQTLDQKLFDEFHYLLSLSIIELKKLEKPQNIEKINYKYLDDSKKNELIRQLKTALENRSSLDCKKVIEEIDTYKLNIEDEIMIKQIKLLIDNRNYKEALRVF